MSRKGSLFNQVPVANVPRNLFNLSHEVKMSGKFGLLYPILLTDAVPGDTFRDQMTAFIRFAPMLAPVMHRIDVTTHFFFVPNRIITDYWEEFITGGQDGTAATILPYITPEALAAVPENMSKGSLWDYLGLPVLPTGANPASEEQLSALPFRAYAKIWNDWYRDPNLDDELDLDLEITGNVTATSIDHGMFQIRNRMWEKDYFTSALPWAQRGAEVLLPLAGTGTVTYSPTSGFYREDDTAPGTGDAAFVVGGNRATIYSTPDGAPAPGNESGMRVENIDEIAITNSDVSINDFRRSLAIQRWLENNARGGGRYIEQIQSHFNVRVPDFRLQRAEYLGGGKQPVTISQVLSTANTDDVPVGDMAGHGVSVGKSNQFTYRCQEHGWVIGIMSIVPRTAYSQGIDKMWTRQSKYDHAWPELANLGEQEILSKEIFFDFENATIPGPNNDVFGYIPRYSEYKFKNDRIAGDFRDTLDFWHLGRMFTARPVLAPEFTTMYENLTTEEETYRRIFANQDGTDYLWCQLFHRLTAKRPLPYFGVPQIR